MAKAAAGRKVLVVRFKRENPNIEGTATSYVRTDKVGRHHGYTVTERPEGVELSKGELPTIFVPWTGVLQVEYTDA
jgi:hypothetical protein